MRLNVDFDLTLTVLADLLYRSLAERLKGFAQAGPSKLFRKFVDTPGVIEITAEGIIVRLSKRAHNPLLKEAGLTQPTRARAVAGRSMRSRRVPLTTPARSPGSSRDGDDPLPPAEARTVECRLGKKGSCENRRLTPRGGSCAF